MERGAYPATYTAGVKKQTAKYARRINKLNAEFLEMTQEQICERAIKEGFKRVIEITKNNEGDLITITYECS